MIIYKITNKINGKVYIGQTTQLLRDRWSDHARPSMGRHKNRSAIASAIRKHGKDNFVIEQIDEAVSLDELNIKEVTYIKAFGCLSPGGYNLELGGNSKACHEETKEKIRETLKGRKIENRWTGGNRTPRTEAQKANLSSKIKGRSNTALFKSVQCIETGKIFESVNAAASEFEVNRVTISSLLKSGKQGVRLGVRGFSFKYLPA